MKQRIVNKLRQSMEAQLAHDIGSVRLDRPDANFQLRRDFFICLSPGQEADDFDFARCDGCAGPMPLLIRVFRIEKSIDRDVGYFLGKEAPAFENGFRIRKPT